MSCAVNSSPDFNPRRVASIAGRPNANSPSMKTLTRSGSRTCVVTLLIVPGDGVLAWRRDSRCLSPARRRPKPAIVSLAPPEGHQLGLEADERAPEQGDHAEVDG